MRIAKQFRFPLAAGLAVLLLVLPFLYRTASAQPSAQAAAQPVDTTVTTTLADQSDLSVTVYNSSLALVRDVRQLTLPAGESRLRFMDIAASINPATVHFRSISEPTRLNVFEQNYEYDLLDPNKLLQKYVGREVTLVRAKLNSGTTQYDEVKATLLSLNGAPVWKIGNEIVDDERPSRLTSLIRCDQKQQRTHGGFAEPADRDLSRRNHHRRKPGQPAEAFSTLHVGPC